MSGVLELTVVGASGLKDKELFTKQDPYVVVEYGSQRFRTKTDKDGGTTPAFNSTFHLQLLPGVEEFSAVIWNDNLGRDDVIGSCRVNFRQAFSAGVWDMWHPVYTKSQKQRGSLHLIIKAPGARAPAGYPPSAYPPAPYPTAPYPAPAPYPTPPNPYPPAPGYPAQPQSAYPPPSSSAYPPPSSSAPPPSASPYPPASSYPAPSPYPQGPPAPYPTAHTAPPAYSKPPSVSSSVNTVLGAVGALVGSAAAYASHGHGHGHGHYPPAPYGYPPPPAAPYGYGAPPVVVHHHGHHGYGHHHYKHKYKRKGFFGRRKGFFK
ncbi:hypothetical protein CLOM_g17174 [Closterium sp. NIES-68]|nr:hypothetical protein CLOM_g17174 [Closterium sp. NIES-68]